MTDNTSLGDLLSVKDVVSKYPSLYATEASLRWHIFSNKVELLRAGVVISRGRRIFINISRLNDWLQGETHDPR